MSEPAPFQHFLATKLEINVANAANKSAFAPSITLSRQAGARAISIGDDAN